MGFLIVVAPAAPESNRRDEDWKALELRKGVVVACWQRVRTDGVKILAAILEYFKVACGNTNSVGRGEVLEESETKEMVCLD